LRAEGKTYREIAKILHISIANISRTLKGPKQKDETTSTPQGEIASQVFHLLEKGRTLSQIVIRLKLEPEIVRDLYSKWVELNNIDVNQPNLEKLDQKLKNHFSDHRGLEVFLQIARNRNAFRKDNCANRLDNSEGFCKFSTCENGGDMEDEEDVSLHCSFCDHFRHKDNIVTLDYPAS